MSNTQDQPNKPGQQGAPQQTQYMPSSGNSRSNDDSGGSQDVERSGMSGAGTQRAADTSTSGDPGRTPGKAEGVENPEEDGNE
jgi:hypothetical protein